MQLHNTIGGYWTWYSVFAIETDQAERGYLYICLYLIYKITFLSQKSFCMFADPSQFLQKQDIFKNGQIKAFSFINFTFYSSNFKLSWHHPHYWLINLWFISYTLNNVSLIHGVLLNWTRPANPCLGWPIIHKELYARKGSNACLPKFGWEICQNNRKQDHIPSASSIALILLKMCMLRKEFITNSLMIFLNESCLLVLLALPVRLNSLIFKSWDHFR